MDDCRNKGFSLRFAFILDKCIASAGGTACMWCYDKESNQGAFCWKSGARQVNYQKHGEDREGGGEVIFLTVIKLLIGVF
jgi:hypothetical protein